MGCILQSLWRGTGPEYLCKRLLRIDPVLSPDPYAQLPWPSPPPQTQIPTQIMTTPKETGNINQIIPTNTDHKFISFHLIHTYHALYKHVLLYVCIYVGRGLTALLIYAAYSSWFPGGKWSLRPVRGKRYSVREIQYQRRWFKQFNVVLPKVFSAISRFFSLWTNCINSTNETIK